MVIQFLHTILFIIFSIAFWYIMRDLKELRHDLNDLTTRYIEYKVISVTKINELISAWDAFLLDENFSDKVDFKVIEEKLKYVDNIRKGKDLKVTESDFFEKTKKGE